MALGFGAFLLTCAVGMMVWQTTVWRSVRGREGMGEEERRYLWRRYRRRMQTGVLMALVAVTLPVADWAVRERLPSPSSATESGDSADASTDNAPSPRLGAAAVGLMLALVGWIVALTVADLWATKVYFGRLRDRYQLEQVRLQAELRRLQTQRAAGSNGRPHTRPDEPV